MQRHRSPRPARTGLIPGLRALGILLALAGSALAEDRLTLTFDRPETAGISGFRPLWDTPVVVSGTGKVEVIDNDRFGKGESAIWSPARRVPETAGKPLPYGTWSGDFWPRPPENAGSVPGATVFDAVHRSLLVRFPGAAEKIAAGIAEGRGIEKVELVLPFRDTELWAEGYAPPRGMSFLGSAWAGSSPEWHAVAFALRRPWTADPHIGPTFNAFINGAGYWAKYGAQDPNQDRFPAEFGPTEVSKRSPEGRMDVTAVVRDESFGGSLGRRLRLLEENGFLVRKWEVYHVGYWKNGYEWASAIGGRGILVHDPRLEVTMGPAGDKPALGELPPPVDVRGLARTMTDSKTGGSPTAVLPSAEQVGKFAERFGFKRPAWMADWQWQRVQELHALGGERPFPQTPEDYARWIDQLLWVTPRSWSGFDATERTQEYMLYSDAMPQPVKDAQALYWWAWLMPDRDISELVQGYVGGDKAQEYYKRTHDWRGNFSVYRTYCRSMGTMNFNHWATAGTLFGGAILGSDRMMAEGRYGLDQYPLRTWCWYDGSTQESIDHYYFAHSLTAQKIFADLGPTRVDRMMGESILAKSIEELTSSYHPGLRRFVSSSGRTGIAYLLGVQDGLQYIIHTLSRDGGLTDVGGGEMPGGMPAFGDQLRPGVVAQQTLNGPWIPDWATPMLDDKPLPYEMTTAYKRWGEFGGTPLWRRVYLGRNYGLASQDVCVTDETVPFMAQWRRADRKAASARDLGTLIGRYGINDTNLLDSVFHGGTTRNPNGVVGTQGGHTVALQERNKMVLLTSPFHKLSYPTTSVPDEVRSLQTTLALFNFEATPSWEIFVDDEKVSVLPFRAKLSQRIAIKDGVSYVGLIPLPATDLGRDVEVVIKAGGTPVELQGGGRLAPTLVIESYNLRRDEPLDKETADWDAIDLAYGGFVVEMGDAAEYRDFEGFRRHLREARLETRFEADAKTLHVAYRSGADTMELGYRPDYKGDWNAKLPTDQVWAYRRVNGRWPYLPEGLDRDSTLTQQGRTGRLEKNGAVLTTEPGRMAYLQTVPSTGTYAGFNPFPDPVDWSLSVPGDVTVRADGKLGLARIAVRPRENRLWIDHAPHERDRGEGMAGSLLVTGLSGEPQVEIDGRPWSGKPTVRRIDGRDAYVIPLTAAPTGGD